MQTPMDPLQVRGHDQALRRLARVEEALPDGHFLFKYTKQGTNNALEGDEVLVLTAANYGPEECWWLLLNPVVQ